MPKTLYTSASAIETADPKDDGCFRKEWFLKCAKLPTPPRAPSTFGDVIHEVCERFESADENGRVDGKPLNLYPEGWERPLNRFTGERSKEAVTLQEQACIKELIDRAITEGILMRAPGRQIERRIIHSPMEGVIINGFIDLLEPEAIRDHKSTKARKWMKSVKRTAKSSLHKNIQLMVYAHWYYTTGGYDKDKSLNLSHQYFVKDPNDLHVEKREIQVTWEEVDTFFKERIAPVIELIINYRTAKNWEEIPLPCNVTGACRKYGGCDFATICTEQETVEQYKRRLEKEISGKSKENYKQVIDNLKQGDEDMAESAMMKKIREKREKQRAGGAASAPAEEAKPKAVAPAVAAKTETAAPAADTGKARAPWYHEGCKACSDNDILGLNKEGSAPCKICDVMTKKAGGKPSSDYTWIVEAGSLTVLDNETGEEVATIAVSEEATAKEVVEEAAQESPKDEKPQTSTVPPETSKDEEPAIQTEAGGPVFENPEILTDRDKFKIMIGVACTESRVKGGGKFGSPSCRVTAEEMMVMVESEMQRILTPTGWQKLNTFERKDAVGIYAKSIADMLGSSTLLVTRMPKSSFLEAVVQSIRPYAGEVWQALMD